MDYREKYYYISTHKSLSAWMRERLEKMGATVQDRITSYTTYILEMRQNVIKTDERTCRNCEEVNRLASEYDIAYFPLETVLSDILDATFNPTWVCNAPEVLKEKRRTCQVLMPRDAGYENYEAMAELARNYGLAPKNRYRKGIGYVVLPKKLTEESTEWLKTVLRRAHADSLYLMREDIFCKICKGNEGTRQNGSESFYHKESTPYQSNADTEMRKALVEEMKQSLQRCNVNFPNEYVVLDCESKRFQERPFEDLITEVGILHVKDGKVVDRYNSLVKSRDVDPHIQEKYRYDTKTPTKTVRVLKKDVLNMVGDLPIVGHGIRKDIYQLGRAFSVSFKNTFVDTEALAKRYLRTNSYKLEDLAEKYGLQTVHHRALGDCETTLQLYQMIQSGYAN